MTDMQETIAAAAKAVTGDDTPEAVKATVQDDQKIIWMRILAGPAMCGIIIGCIVLLAWGPKIGVDFTRLTETARVNYIGTLACVCATMLGFVFWMLMPGRPTKLEIKAGPAGITLEGGR